MQFNHFFLALQRILEQLTSPNECSSSHKPSLTDATAKQCWICLEKEKLFKASSSLCLHRTDFEFLTYIKKCDKLKSLDTALLAASCQIFLSQSVFQRLALNIVLIFAVYHMQAVYLMTMSQV